MEVKYTMKCIRYLDSDLFIGRKFLYVGFSCVTYISFRVNTKCALSCVGITQKVSYQAISLTSVVIYLV